MWFGKSVVQVSVIALFFSGMWLAVEASAVEIKGQVMGGGAPIAQSTVILMQASAGEPNSPWCKSRFVSKNI